MKRLIWIEIGLFLLMMIGASYGETNDTAVDQDGATVQDVDSTSPFPLETATDQDSTGAAQEDFLNSTQNSTQEEDVLEENINNGMAALQAEETQEAGRVLKPVSPVARGFEVILEFQYMIWSIIKVTTS